MADIGIDYLAVAMWAKRPIVESLIGEIQDLEMRPEVLCQLNITDETISGQFSTLGRMTYVYPSQRSASCASDSIILSR